MQEVAVFIGLGSNLQDPKAQISTALLELNALASVTVLLRSGLYQSKPMGQTNQPDFMNAVAKISTSLGANDLLLALQKIEQDHQRVRSSERWGPRTLDLDILLYGDQQISTRSLEVPHPGLAAREFVLIPLQEIDPNLIIPGIGTLQELVEQLPLHQMKMIDTIHAEPQP